MNNDSPVDINKEKKLLEAIQSLPDAETPSRDLWAGIADQLTKRETKTYTPRWIPWAIAATLLLSFSSVFVSWTNLQTANQALAENNISNQKVIGVHAQLKAMEQEFGLAKSALLSQIAMNSTQTDADLMSDVKSNMIIIEQATNQLKAAIIKQPENPSLQKLLQATYQQELVVLTQLAKLDTGV